MQAANDALATLKAPAKHGATLLPLPVNPASAKHSSSVTVPVARLVPELIGHAEHATAPMAALKVPAEQAVGEPPLGPVYPSSARQAVLAIEPESPPV